MPLPKQMNFQKNFGGRVGEGKEVQEEKNRQSKQHLRHYLWGGGLNALGKNLLDFGGSGPLLGWFGALFQR